MSLDAKEGRDPLGLQTTTQDRLMPVLLPGMLELTRRARYFSFYAFLLDEYRDRRLAADPKSQAMFLRHREWDLGLAVQRCPRRCGSSPVGARRLGGTSRGPGPFPRGESVQTSYGGYGLYYRSPMVQTGLVARAGTPLGDEPIPIDVLRGTPRARVLAEAFRDAVQGTDYYQREFLTANPLDEHVVDELAAVACLCRLDERPDEQDAVRAALFDDDPDLPAGEDAADTDDAGRAPGGEVVQRRRSVAHYLTLLQSDSAVAGSEAAYREAIWSSSGDRGPDHAVVAGQWAALVAKDVWQDALCSVWSQFCRSGIAESRRLGRGLTWVEAQAAARALCAGPPPLDPALPTADLAAAIARGEVAVDDAVGAPVDPGAATLEELRALTDGADTAASGLIVALELTRRAAARDGQGWQAAARAASAWQPSLADVLTALATHMQGGPAVADTLWWLVSRFVLPVHERIAYSKLPEFTFRFRWEDGLLRFYDQGAGRFPLAAVRNEPLALITRDLGLWSDGPGGAAQVTPAGSAFVAEALG